MSHALGRHVRVLGDGRRVTLRHAVPSDAPRLAAVAAPVSETGVIALDDHGDVVGHAGEGEVAVSERWTGSGLEELLWHGTGA